MRTAARTVVCTATPAKREAYARQVGGDGFHLLDALAALATPEGLDQLPPVLAFRRVWARHFEQVENDGDPSTVPGPPRGDPLRNRVRERRPERTKGLETCRHEGPRHIGDFRRWKDYNAYQQAFIRILRDVKAASE